MSGREAPARSTPANDLLDARCACGHRRGFHQSGPTARTGCLHCPCRRWYRISLEAGAPVLLEGELVARERRAS